MISHVGPCQCHLFWCGDVDTRLCSVSLYVQHVVEVLSLLSDDVETDDAEPGENLKLRLKGIEEEEILPGFILCNAENLCHSGRTFDAQVSAHGRSAGITGPIDTTFTAKRYVHDDWACIETTCTAAVHVVRNESQA